MKYTKDLVVLIMATGLMLLLGLIVYDEFSMAAEHDAELDQNIIELLQMSITGIVGVVAGYVSGKDRGCGGDAETIPAALAWDGRCASDGLEGRSL